jgi:hypothetical protein
MPSTISLKKYFIFLLSIFLFSSCGNKKEAVLLEVLEAIGQDNIAKIEHLCTPECFKQIQIRKRTFQSLLIGDWDLDYNHLKCTEGETVAKCSICRDENTCSPLDILKLRNKDGAWLVEYNERSPIVTAERFLGYLGKMDFEAAKEVAIPRLKKELELMGSAIKLLKETGMLNKEEISKLRSEITNIVYFDPAIQWIKCEDDPRYKNTKFCFLCDPLHGQTNEVVTVTLMKDKKWYVVE